MARLSLGLIKRLLNFLPSASIGTLSNLLTQEESNTITALLRTQGTPHKLFQQVVSLCREINRDLSDC